MQQPRQPTGCRRGGRPAQSPVPAQSPSVPRLARGDGGERRCRLEAEVAGVREEVEAVNRERKLQQTAAGADLAALEDRWHRLVLKNAEIEVPCPPSLLSPSDRVLTCSGTSSRALDGRREALVPPHQHPDCLPLGACADRWWVNCSGSEMPGARSTVCPAYFLLQVGFCVERMQISAGSGKFTLHLINCPSARATWSRI